MLLRSFGRGSRGFWWGRGWKGKKERFDRKLSKEVWVGSWDTHWRIRRGDWVIPGYQGVEKQAPKSWMVFRLVYVYDQWGFSPALSRYRGVWI